MAKEKVILAYSGGLDTSVILKWLLEKDYEVIAYVGDVGQDDDYEAVKEKAPFWAEKLPEFPELIYDGLKQFKNQQHQLNKMQQAFHEHSRSMAKSRFWGMLGGALLIVGAVLYGEQDLLAKSASILGAIACFKAYLHTSKG